MLTPSRTKISGSLRTRAAARRVPTSPRQRLLWTVGNLMLFAGIYLLLYVGGIYVQIDYLRLAARGDNDLEVPRTTLSALLAAPHPAAAAVAPHPAAAAAAVAPRPTAVVQAAPTAAPAISVPQLSAAEGQIASDVPSAAQLAHVSTVSRVVIPSIALDSKVIEVGWSTQEINGKVAAIWDVAEYAIGQHRGSANPGEGGNIVLAGHVGGYGHVFRDLFYVHPGDQITVYSGGQEFLYVVKERLIVEEDDAPPEQRIQNAKLIAPTDHEQITMITCWPPKGPDKFKQRVVVHAVPVSAPASPAPENSAVR
jgi:LPXTG-site transpeptidase (sortase) family protein